MRSHFQYVDLRFRNFRRRPDTHREGGNARILARDCCFPRMMRRESFDSSALHFLVLGLILGLCSGQEILNTYYVQWSMVPTANVTKDLTANCICDVTSFSCDPSCCCDPNCPASVTAAAQANGTCLPQGPPDQTLDYCVSSNFVQKARMYANSCIQLNGDACMVK